MKKPIYILILFAIAGVFAACKKQQLMTYNAPDNIYFFYKRNNVRLDTMDFSFAYSPLSVTDSIVKIPFTITGVPVNNDREFVVTVDPSSTAKPGVNFVLPDKFVLSAGKLVDSFSIKLIRTKDLQTNTLSLRLNLNANNNFQIALKDIASAPGVNALSFKINISDVLNQGSFWSGVYSTYFGTFSVKKLRLLNQVAGMPLDYVINGIYDLNLNARCAFWAISMSRYLKDQQNAGTPVYDEDGTLMVMAPSYQ
ncbi:DUF4843 domain-containing protein [Chitinophaga arvensicola]|uniref:DUF4843 domain-containing protein n=1 Tax=Chitinophaga arvensicola TaxID=29529 RepID=A0A1I0R3H1_9BACT|nr:DUF4843 domain-containing protein [Chitinophaga arvensicola]SEW35040.1 protein of unknown function [Chitinophaga arvensicola]